MKLAQRFIAGTAASSTPSPVGTADIFADLAQVPQLAGDLAAVYAQVGHFFAEFFHYTGEGVDVRGESGEGRERY